MLKYNSIYLKPIDKNISETLREYRNSPELFQWFRQHTLISDSQQEKWIESLSNDKSQQLYSIWVAESGALIGVVGLTSIDYIHRKAELSIYVIPEAQHKGYAKDACKAILDIGFNSFNLHRIWLEVFQDSPAIKFYEKMGFIHEGKLKQSYFKNGKYINSFIMGIIRQL